ncbi:replication-relaxation family protein [Streptomyces kaempferi]|uniref:Replication-relaxation family protein n=1 Tax=Streptomyces kaempferi TaxID=333725 RepID=A0ABW3XTI6_9ACTN
MRAGKTNHCLPRPRGGGSEDFVPPPTRVQPCRRSARPGLWCPALHPGIAAARCRATDAPSCSAFPGRGGAGPVGSWRRRLRSHCRCHFRARPLVRPCFPWAPRLFRAVALRHNPLLSSTPGRTLKKWWGWGVSGGGEYRVQGSGGAITSYATEVGLPVAGTWKNPGFGSARADIVCTAPQDGVPLLFIEVDNCTEDAALIAAKFDKYMRFFQRKVKDTDAPVNSRNHCAEVLRP